MEVAQWATTILLTGVVSVLSYDRFRKWKEGQHHFSEQFISRSKIYAVIHNVTRKTSCKRFLILKTANGGGRPKIGARIYATVLYEDCYAPFASVAETYVKVFVDKMYIEMLRKIALDGFVSFDVATMKPGLLKDMYDAEGVMFSQVFYLTETDSAFYYCSVATDETGVMNMTSKKEQLMIKLNIEKLRNIFKNIK